MKVLPEMRRAQEIRYLLFFIRSDDMMHCTCYKTQTNCSGRSQRREEAIIFSCFEYSRHR